MGSFGAAMNSSAAEASRIFCSNTSAAGPSTEALRFRILSSPRGSPKILRSSAALSATLTAPTSANDSDLVSP